MSRIGTLIAALALMGACTELDLTQGEDLEVGKSSDALNVLTTNLWPDVNGETPIDVCWATTGFGTQKGWVKDAIRWTWGEESRIDFRGWGDCPSSSSGIRITISDERPHTSGLGISLAGKQDGMVLNFSFNNWSQGCKDHRESCIRSIAVHEFGHALGFSHEQNRADSPADCLPCNVDSDCGTNETCTDHTCHQGTDGDAVYGAWDIDSVMNYCNPKWNNGGKLSNIDVAGLTNYYGLPDCAYDASLHRGDEGARRSCICSSSATASGSVWGTDLYTDDSKLCRAARHAGQITSTGGVITYEVEAGQSSYSGSTQNGVSSQSAGSSAGSYLFVPREIAGSFSFAHGGNMWEQTFTTVVGGDCSAGWIHDSVRVSYYGAGSCWFERWESGDRGDCRAVIGVRNLAGWLNGTCYGTILQAQTNWGDNGDAGYCSPEEPCSLGEGSCSGSGECVSGTVCVDGGGTEFGFESSTNVCYTYPLGHSNYCSATHRCTAGHGDCDGNSQCAEGLVCRRDVGSLYGFAAAVDVCELPPRDLVVSSLTRNPISPNDEDVISFGATVTNRGRLQAPATTLNIWIGSTGDSQSFAVPSLAAGASYGPIVRTATLAPGTYDYGATADADSAFAEYFELNNSRTDRVEVTLAQPDLVVQSLTRNSTYPPAGSSITITAVVKNQGDKVAPASTMTLAMWDVSVPKMRFPVRFSIPALAPGETAPAVSKTYSTASTSERTYRYEATVDVDDVIDEADEGNNHTSRQVTTRLL